MKNEKKKREKKNNYQKSFYFEDYSESENIINNDNIEKKISGERITFVFFVFIFLIFIFSAKITYLSLSKSNSYFSKNNISKPIHLLPCYYKTNQVLWLD